MAKNKRTIAGRAGAGIMMTWLLMTARAQTIALHCILRILRALTTTGSARR
jgi:hypothetical protein